MVYSIFDLLSKEEKARLQEYVVDWCNKHKEEYPQLKNSREFLYDLFEAEDFKDLVTELVEDIPPSTDFNKWSSIRIHDSEYVDMEQVYKDRNIRRISDIDSIWEIMELLVHTNIYRYIEASIPFWVRL